jgi:hypothetical protein
MKKERKGICAFCGSLTIVTNDHVPPSNIFPGPQPNDVELVTVPGCKKCNHGSTVDDEQFKVYITLKSGVDGAAPLKLHQSTKRTVRRNRKIRKQIVENSTPLYLPSGDSSTFEIQNIYKFDPGPIRRVARKIIKGLYFKHFGECIDGKAEVSVYLSDDIKHHQITIIEDLARDTGRLGEHHTVGQNREFHYAFAETEVKYATSWVLVFNHLCAMVGLTIPKENIPQVGGEEPSGLRPSFPHL